VIPEISEFSYGFALTNELVGWLELFAAPIFPSLLEEGKAGGGYDVKLDSPGAPLYLQFKRSECMTRRSAREYRSIRDQGGRLRVPFYRFPITEAVKSDQHELLLALDTLPNHVFYAAPRFHQLSEINDAWRASAVASRSVFVSPSEIGSVDDARHTVAFDRSYSWVCSDPRPLRALNSREVLEKLQGTLREDTRPLRTRLPALVEELRDAERRGRERIFEKRRQAEREAETRRAAPSADQTFERQMLELEHFADPIPTLEGRRRLEALETPESTPPATREPKPLGPEMLALREASDMAARVFDAQLIIVQPVE
jgi:hypothetical protein